ncbi:MAG: hypothetical protein OJF60_000043 [Burkholderiaceae bacterium]|nr:MAG: hypothetical protein OJF60_000043 [Burkholderiaceae bacterium]
MADGLLAYPQGSVRSIAYSPDGRQLATGNIQTTKSSPDIAVAVWDANTHALLATPLGGPSEDAADNSALAYTADGRYLLAAFRDKDGPIDIIDAHTLRLVDTVHAFSVSMFAIAVERRGPRFVVTSGRNLMIWTLQDNP